nr:queuosine tRNA-ribosyltransferase [Achromobacter phage vB_Ade_ART]
MKVYIAGIYTSNFHKGGNYYEKLDNVERAGHDSSVDRLESYHYIWKQSYIDRIRANGDTVFLDSGAFSAFSLGVEVNLPAYVEWIQHNEDLVRRDDGILMASVLDGIGDPLKTWQNQQAMEALGVCPLPCFHYGEDERYLEWYIQHYEYITIGGMVPISTPQLFHWLDRIWAKYLTDGSGRPRLKVHGFGLTSVPLMQRYPWYSVDSSSWVQLAAHGNVFIPGQGQYAISARSPNVKVEGQHIDTLPPIMREALEQKIRDAGYDPQRFRDLNYPRWAYNVWAYSELGRMMESKPQNFHNKQMELLG